MSRCSMFARSVVFSLSVILYIVYRIGDFQQLAPMLSILSIIAIGLSIPVSSLSTRIFTLFFVTAGTWLVLKKGTDLYHYLLIYGDMLYLLSFFAVLPLLTIPLKLGSYDRSIQQILQEKTQSVNQLYRTISSISFLLSSFLNLATIPIMYYSIKGSVEKIVSKNPDKFMCLAIIHGYAVSVAWSPFSGGVAVALETTGVPWAAVFYKLFIISIFGLLLNWLVYGISAKLAGENPGGTLPSDPGGSISEIAATEEMIEDTPLPVIQKPFAKILQIVFIIMLLILIVVGLTSILSLGLVVTTTVVAFPFALVWALMLKKGAAFLGEIKSYVIKNMPGMADQFAIFLSTGFFVRALQYSGYNHFVNESVLRFNHFVGPHLFLLILPLITLGCGLIGMHPITAITLLAESMNPSLMGISAEHLAIALVGGAVMTFSIGPFSGTLNMFSIIVRRNTFRIASWNLINTAVFFLFLAVTLLLI